MVEIRRPFIYNPDEESKDSLIATFAIRQNLFEKIYKEIKRSDKKSAPQHFLIIGQRGMGKTTLLLRIKYAIEDDAKLSQYLLPVRFSEEQYNIASLPDLWEETARYLESLHPDFEGLYDKMIEQDEGNDYERIAFDLIAIRLRESGKRALLMIDNVGELLEKLKGEHRRLREILMTSPYIQLISASSEMLEHTFQYDKPFFEFFSQVKLEPIGKEETIHMMRVLAKNYDAAEKIEHIIQINPGRIEALRRLTGGVPRTLVLLFEIFIDHNEGSVFEYLEQLIDRVLPLYKARMDALKPQQQKIVDALARAWEAISASEVLKRSRLARQGLTSNQISAQLNQLAENQLVEIVEVGKRKRLYRIRERFFNIWYLMRNGRKEAREQVLWLVHFLESWCTQEELSEVAHKQIGHMREGKYSQRGAFYKAMAFQGMKNISIETKEELLEHTEAFLIKMNKDEWAKQIHVLLLEEQISWLDKIRTLLHAGQFIELKENLIHAINKGKKGLELLAGLAYYLSDDIDNAIYYYLKAIEKGENEALYYIALVYEVRKDNKNAEMYYKRAVEKGIELAERDLGTFYAKNGNFKKAEKYLLLAVHHEVKDSNFLLGMLYDENEKYREAIAYYSKAAEQSNSDAMNNLGIIYAYQKKDSETAKKYFLQAIEHNSLRALNNIALIYQETGDYKLAEQYYLEAIQFFVQKAAKNLLKLYWRTGQFQEGIRMCEQVFNEEEYVVKDQDSIRYMIDYLLINQQHYFVYTQFIQEGSLLRKYFLPYYYVVAWYLRDKLPGEYEKAGNELKETVDEIIAMIEEQKKAKD